MSKMKKIMDKSMNLDVKGQGCWDDCFVRSGYWERRTSTPNCNYIAAKYDWVTNPFL